MVNKNAAICDKDAAFFKIIKNLNSKADIQKLN